MALDGPGRFVSYEKSRTLIYISKKIADASAFPFEAGDQLVVHIDADDGRLIIEKAEQLRPLAGWPMRFGPVSSGFVPSRLPVVAPSMTLT